MGKGDAGCSTDELRHELGGGTGVEPITGNPMSSAHQNVRTDVFPSPKRATAESRKNFDTMTILIYTIHRQYPPLAELH